MSNLKRRYVEVTLAVVILLIITLSGGYAFGDDKPVKPLVDFMFTPPNSIYAEYGFSDETFQLYNFVRLKEICQIFEAQIAALRAEIDELKKLVAMLSEDQAQRLNDEGVALMKKAMAIPNSAKAIKLEGADPFVITGSKFLDPNEVAK